MSSVFRLRPTRPFASPSESLVFPFRNQLSNTDLFPSLRSLLTSVQTSTGQDITVDTVTGLITGNTLVPLLNSLPAAQLCTDCSKGLVTNIKALVPANMTTSVNSAVSGKCGASFVDGRIPAGVSAFSSNSTGGPGAVTSTPLGAGESLRVEKTLTALALVAIAGWFL